MKKRRDITLGEMQDECSFRGHNCETVGGEPCEYYGICNQIRTKSCTPPKDWDLSDPPRFNEQQMALLKALRGLGFVSVENIGGGFKTTSEDGKTGLFMELLGVEYGEKIDLAELLGKDAT